MSETLEVFLCQFFTYLAARRCTISSFWMFDWVCGSQTVLAYATNGFTRVKYAFSLMAVVPDGSDPWGTPEFTLTGTDHNYCLCSSWQPVSNLVVNFASYAIVMEVEGRSTFEDSYKSVKTIQRMIVVLTRCHDLPKRTGTGRNGRTGTDQNGPERTKTDLRK